MSGFVDYNYLIVIALLMIGLYVVAANTNMVKKILGLNIFQTAVFVMYISFAKVDGGTAPIIAADGTVYSNPLPHVLILTAIVVGVATTAVAAALAGCKWVPAERSSTTCWTIPSAVKTRTSILASRLKRWGPTRSPMWSSLTPTPIRRSNPVEHGGTSLCRNSPSGPR